jgi:transcription-repair coupling factor (superfamily II helicase)
MISSIKESIHTSEPFQRFRDECARDSKNRRISIAGISGSLMAFVADLLAEQYSQVLLIVPEKDRAEQLRDDCIFVSPEKNVNLFADAEHHSATTLDMSGPISAVESLYSLVKGEPGIVVASAEAVVSLLPAPSEFSRRNFTLTTGGEVPFQELLDRLEGWGFERKDFVEAYGDFAVRGGILDVFPFVGDHPLRIEFFGDTVESIREFEPLSQRSVRELRSASIVAAFSAENQKDRSATVLNYLSESAILLVHEITQCEREVDELFREGIRGIIPWKEFLDRSRTLPQVLHSSLQTSGQSADIHFGSSPQPAFHGSIRLLLENLRQDKTRTFRQIIACDTAEEELRLRELLEEEIREEEDGQEHWRGPELISEALHGGFVYPAASLTLFTEHELFGRLKRRGRRGRPRFRGFSQREVSRLKKGDFVVHTDYGLGRFAGLQTIKVHGHDQEVMKILYEEDDALYVNLNFVNRVQKYSSQEGHKPKLTKLGTPQWDRTKARVRKRIKDIARELIRLYATRKHEPGFAFSADSHWQKEMEASFIYEDTPDQSKATEAVKKDMQEAVPMDRLICGDVGFGKTEVAVRAAFKAALDGKQSAVLVPTTILAQQHYQTFVDRLGRYSVRVAALTRFRSKKEQQKILEDLKEGSLDVVIGTHRLLSKDIVFKDLGLLIVDEEHRFGVTAKEKLRQLRASVDTLMLTATPIPRTLQFSLMGARDLSIINTPPRNRLPIVTEISELDLDLVREAVLKELHRAGQVYVIHDRIQTMDLLVLQLKKKIPEARFHAAHGQMKGHELEKTMVEFLERKYDVLVCTKIIESGIDIPRVNTIIINRADRFGLAELYQLRGRVGRSNVQAYAYLLTPPLATLPRAALQRLQSVQEFTELGSGFNLALRDMEIRGAGNLLGAEQSGFIMEMGFEMYQRVVEEAVQELKTEEFQGTFDKEIEKTVESGIETILESDLEALIPDIYVESDQERLDIYRRLYQARTLDDVRILGEELKDRFGDFPVEVDLLLQQVEVKTLAEQLRIPRVELIGHQFLLSFPFSTDVLFYGTSQDAQAPFQVIMALLTSSDTIKFHLHQQGPELKLKITLLAGIQPAERLREASSILSRFAAAIEPTESRQ